MKIVLLLCIVTFAVTVSSQEEPKKAIVCEAGQSFKKACNICRCSTDGTDFACTRKSCPDAQVQVQDNAGERQKRGANESCVPKSEFMKDCNKCKCNEDGTKAACTLKKCPPNKNKRDTKTCEPGKTYKDGCNTCTCNADGTRARCTLIKCP